ncbi:RNA recognition motif domain-containing protein [Chloroflexota bacterium]
MNIFVGNLAFQVTEEELRQEFMAFGEVTSVIVVSDRDTGGIQSRRHGFLQMPSKSEGYAAIAGLKEKTLKGRMLDVIEALPLSHKTGSGTPGVRKGGYSGRRRHRWQLNPPSSMGKSQ